MIKVEKVTTNPIVGHNAVVFANKQDSDNKDMSNAIGRYDNKRREIAFLDGTTLGKKYKALADAGFQLFIEPDARNNFYIVQVHDAISKLNKGSYADFALKESIEDVEDENKEAVELDKVDKQESDDEDNELGKSDKHNTDDDNENQLEYVEEQEFMNKHIDSAMDLDFTTDNLKYEHRVGLYNELDNVYTLRDDTKEILDEFTFKVDENEDGVVARINPESLNGRKLLMLINLLKKQEQDDDDELKEALESDRANVAAFPIVKSLLSRMRLAQKHGDIEESEEAEVELNELISKYENANPPALGIDEIKKQRDDILSKKESVDKDIDEKSKSNKSKPNKPKQTRSQRVGQAVDKAASSHSSTYRKAKKIYKSASNIAKSLKREDEKALAESILEQSGVQIRGSQQTGVSYVY